MYKNASLSCSWSKAVRINDDECFKFTVSIGVAAIHPQYTQLRQAFTQADEALYNAKKNGRNCTYVENTA